MDADRCRATVTLDEPLRRSLASWSGRTALAHVHGCVLRGGHHGKHRAMANPEDERCWFRWDDTGFRLGIADASHRAPWGGQHQSPRHADFAARSSHAGSAAGTTNLTTPPPRRGRHAADANAPYRAPQPRSPTEALWAIAAALQRLADFIAAASASTILRPGETVKCYEPVCSGSLLSAHHSMSPPSYMATGMSTRPRGRPHGHGRA